jgi:serine/threonine protein phosphatase PrpC
MCETSVYIFICSFPLFREKREIQNLTAYRRIAVAMLVGIADGLGGASCSGLAAPSLHHGLHDRQQQYVQLHTQNYIG